MKLVNFIIFICIIFFFGNHVSAKKVNPTKTSGIKSRKNAEHSKTVKIKVAKVNDDVVIVDEKSLIQKQQSFIGAQQMITSVVTMILSRMIFKLNFK
jgi:hypothetical protein